jgi:DNA-binding MarR family transcriptional regulator
VQYDHVDEIVEQWTRERPDLDLSPMATVGRIFRASRHLEQDVSALLSRYQLTVGQFNVLAALRRAGVPYRLSPAVLSRSLLLSTGTMTNRLEQLRERDLIERLPDENDGRGLLVGLTGKGRELVDEAFEAHLSNERRLIDALSAKEQALLTDLLRVLLISFEPHAGLHSGERDRAPTK